MQAKAHAWPFLAVQASEHFLARAEGTLVRTTLDAGLQHEVEDVVEHASCTQVSGVALVVVARADGALVAMAGSRRDHALGLDATRCERPAGSTLKPFLYALALERGALGGHGTLADTPVEIAGYRPSNFTRTFAGTITLEDALSESRNVPAVRLLRMVGVDAFRDQLARLGLAVPESTLGLDAALGTVSVRPLELARAYALLSRDDGPCRLAPADRAALLGALSLRSPDPRWVEAGRVAFKTGTSSDRRDAWTAAVTERHVVVAWLGDPGGRSEPGLVGARAASELVAPLVAALGER
jgi:penicillin-binding protein 1C